MLLRAHAISDFSSLLEGVIDVDYVVRPDQRPRSETASLFFGTSGVVISEVLAIADASVEKIERLLSYPLNHLPSRATLALQRHGSASIGCNTKEVPRGSVTLA